MTAELTEIRVSYSIGVKANLGNYESADVQLSKSETWNVEGLDETAAQCLEEERYGALREELGNRAIAEYDELVTERR